MDRINKNILDANVKLQDENKYLKLRIKDIENNIHKALDFILDKSEEYKTGYRKVELNTKECWELMEILESELYEQ